MELVLDPQFRVLDIRDNEMIMFDHTNKLYIIPIIFILFQCFISENDYFLSVN